MFCEWSMSGWSVWRKSGQEIQPHEGKYGKGFGLPTAQVSAASLMSPQVPGTVDDGKMCVDFRGAFPSGCAEARMPGEAVWFKRATAGEVVQLVPD